MVDRRAFLLQLAAGTCWLGRQLSAEVPGTPHNNSHGGRFPLCTFVKYLQSLSFDELADAIAELGLDGIEATIRPRGQILPEQAADRLPELVEALSRRGLDITIMTSGINSTASPHAESVLRTAASLGVKRYRMDYYRYDLKRPVVDQLRALKPVVQDLAALNREIGITGLYQNHAGAQYVGAGLWDLCELLDGIDPDEIGIAYDVRHATAEGGLSWQTTWNRVQPHLRAVYVKDCDWQGRKLRDVPLGEGIVRPEFFPLLSALQQPLPISLHVEYLDREPPADHLAAIGRDLQRLKESLPEEG